MLERERERTEEHVVAHFECWARNPQLRDWICRNWISPEERRRRMREIFGLAPEPPEEASPTPPESNPVKLNPTLSNPITPDEAVESDVGVRLVPSLLRAGPVPAEQGLSRR